jgi:hypothetical protein
MPPAIENNISRPGYYMFMRLTKHGEWALEKYGRMTAEVAQATFDRLAKRFSVRAFIGSSTLGRLVAEAYWQRDTKANGYLIDGSCTYVRDGAIYRGLVADIHNSPDCPNGQSAKA